MSDATNSDPSPLGPVRPSLELIHLRVSSSFIDVSLEIQHGILNVWFGANGSGKSLMLRAVRAVLLGDYSEFGNDNGLFFDATFAIPQNVELWTKIRDHVDRESLFDGFIELAEEDEDGLTQEVDKILNRMEDSLINPSPGVDRPRIKLDVVDGRENFFILGFENDREDISGPIKLGDGFRSWSREIFPEPVYIDNNLINALPNWLPKVLAWGQGQGSDILFPSSFSFDRAQRDPVAASVFFETTPRNSETAHTEVEWNVRVKEEFQELIERLIQLSQHFLPTFVSESWILTYQFSPPTFGNQPIQIKLRSRTGDSNDMMDLANASEGIKRWVTISLAIASINLWSSLEKEFLQNLFDSFDDPRLIEVPHFYFLIDEPEAHLSPNAVSSVASPINKLAPMTTLIATHSPNLIDGLKGDATFRGIRGTKRTREVHTFPLTDFVYLRGFEEEMGLRASELLLRNGRLLLVEGDHDEIVLKHWFGPELDDHGVYVVKTSGAYHLNAILKLPLLKDVSKRVAVLLDKSDYELPPYLEGVEARVFTLSQLDILYYVPAAAVRTVAPDFTTWEETWRDFESQPGRGSTGKSKRWKRFIDKKYHLNLSFEIQKEVDAEWENDLKRILEKTILESISRTQEETKLEDELAQKVAMIINWFEEPT